MKHSRLTALLLTLAACVSFSAASASTVRAAGYYSDDRDDDYDAAEIDTWWEGRVAHWEGISGAEQYEVQLYRGNSSVTSITTENEQYAFGQSMRYDGNYSFRVRVIRGGSRGKWSDRSDEEWFSSINGNGGGSSSSSSSSSSEKRSSSYTGTPNYGPGGTSTASSVGIGSSTTPGWKQDSKGWWYMNADGSIATSGWQLIGGAWYFFGPDGYMQTGWIRWDGLWYYCGSSGAMLTDTVTPDGYRVDGSGVWVP